jgi:hypothetical protein
MVPIEILPSVHETRYLKVLIQKNEIINLQIKISAISIQQEEISLLCFLLEHVRKYFPSLLTFIV